MKSFRLGHYLKTSLWFVPLLCILGGVVLSLVTTTIDDGTLIPESVTGDPAAALQILYLVSFAMLTLTGLALSLLLLIVQLSMGVFSPRVVRQVLEDRPSQVAIGLFAGTFSHSMLSMRAVKTTADGGSTPGLAVVVAMVLAFACIATLAWYLDHIGQSVRVAAMMRWVANDTLAALNNVYPDKGEAEDLGPGMVVGRSGGVLFVIDHEQLVTRAQAADCQLELLYGIGDFVPTGAAIVRVIGDPTTLSHSTVRSALAVGPERTLNQDVAYGIRMIVDVAAGSLSSGPFQDPTTSVQAIDRLHDILRQMVNRPLHSGRYSDRDGVLRVTIPTIQWSGYVRLAFDEVRQAGAASPQVSRRLRAALEDLLTVAPPDRKPALERQITLLTDVASVASSTEEDRREAIIPDKSGIGSAEDLVNADPIGADPIGADPVSADRNPV